ncbi:uncharacterized protein [Henckelia pumila]|uniref:uncharacterized protein isoform X2 n=1 Tax=Henckelia pumila TaxID=405737 RepID=UPI003C6E2746
MRGESAGHSHSRPCFGRKTLRRCRNSQEADDVILIDVDSDHFDNVIIIDVPDSLPKKRKGSSILREDNNGLLQTVIYIDDDESSDKFNSFAGASSSKSFKPHAEDFEDVDAEENPYIQENVTPVRLSKCKRTYSGKASAGKGYGLNLDSEDNSSDNDHPDCELMEDIYGKVQEQWQKAYRRRKKGIKNDQSGIRSQNGASSSMNDSSYQTVGRKGENDKYMEAPDLFDTGKFNNEDEGTSPLSEEEDAQHPPSIHIEPEDHQYFEPGSSSHYNGKKFKKSTSYSSHKKPKMCVDGNSDYCKASSVKDDVTISKGQNAVEAEAEADPVNIFPAHEFRESQVTSTGRVNEMDHLESCDLHESGSVEKTSNLTSARSSFMSSILPEEQTLSEESSCFQNSSLGSREGIKKGCNGENRRTVDGIPFSRNIHVHVNDAQVGLDESVSNSGEEDKDEDFHPENGLAVDSVESCILGEREKHKETDGYKIALEEERVSRHQALKNQADFHPENGHAVDSVESCMLGEREKHKETDGYKIALEEEWASRHQALKIQKRSKAENTHTMDSVESCMIGEREKFKETDEYKRAMEKEWASRQEALKIQAEEAQHLRRLQKRRKAESLRLMDMERRQKERIEEMRSTQKKDEENMNLKEVIRAEVRTELNKLEMTCQNMSSLLHSFGIQIEGWPNPSSQEVQTAYKKALLTFHPDRASRSDIRQQVEAEEKFKLINRVKEKFSSVL